MVVKGKTRGTDRVETILRNSLTKASELELKDPKESLIFRKSVINDLRNIYGKKYTPNYQRSLVRKYNKMKQFNLPLKPSMFPCDASNNKRLLYRKSSVFYKNIMILILHCLKYKSAVAMSQDNPEEDRLYKDTILSVLLVTFLKIPVKDLVRVRKAEILDLLKFNKSSKYKPSQYPSSIRLIIYRIIDNITKHLGDQSFIINSKLPSINKSLRKLYLMVTLEPLESSLGLEVIFRIQPHIILSFMGNNKIIDQTSTKTITDTLKEKNKTKQDIIKSIDSVLPPKINTTNVSSAPALNVLNRVTEAIKYEPGVGVDMTNQGASMNFKIKAENEIKTEPMDDDDDV
jgi:hypothetical protein